MSFISYAQNLEDVILYRSLKTIEAGYYIDIGAQHPQNDSVTKAFYDRGWHGINIEPNEDYFNLLKQERPRDLNLNLAISNHKSTVPYYKISQTGMSTIRKHYANQYMQAGYKTQFSRIPCTTLDEVCAQYEVHTVHFLSIDVEGAEKAVLQGFSFLKVRPWIVIIEANEPLSTRDISHVWEPLIVTRGYACVYYDGLNRYYLAEEKHELKRHFATPPNIFDDYVKYNFEASQKSLASERQQWEYEKANLQQDLNEAKGETEHTYSEFENIYQEKQQVNRELATIKKQLGQMNIKYNTTRQELKKAATDRDNIKQKLELTLVERNTARQALQETSAERDIIKQALNQTRLERENGEREILRLKQALSGEQAQCENLAQRLATVYASRSWRYLTPLRKTKDCLWPRIKKVLRAIAHVALWVMVRIGPVKWLGTRLLKGHPTVKARLRRIAGLPNPESLGDPTPAINKASGRHKILRILLKPAVPRLNRMFRLNRLLRSFLSKFPPLEMRVAEAWHEIQSDDIILYINRKSGITTKSHHSKDEEIESLNKVPVTSGLSLNSKKYIFYWINDTVKTNTNTGVQRLTRCLAGALMELEAEIVFVCWDAQQKALVRAKRAELEYLSAMNGPNFTNEFLSKYTGINSGMSLLNEQVSSEQTDGAWLLIPEVINKLTGGVTPAPAVIDYARKHHIKTAFVFYDAIPLKLKDYNSSTTSHAEYMKCLGFADIVLPISRFSREDLVGYLVNNQGFKPETLPTVRVLPLPAEVCKTPRVTGHTDSGDDIIILCVGTVEPRKNQLVLLQAFQQLCDRFPGAPLKLIISGNLHPKVAIAFRQMVRRNRKIAYLEYADDARLADVYQQCSFTVFPSVEEGFGLPIAESLWYGKPVICASFGSMAEIAKGGGCLTIDTRSVSEMEDALGKMVFDKELRNRLMAEAVSRPLKSWRDYALEVLGELNAIGEPALKIKKIYYWVDHTCIFPSNSGIQRVVRGLARSLQLTGVKLIPIRWDNGTRSFYPPSEKELQHLASFNGPDLAMFSPFALSEDESGSWLVIPELTNYYGGPNLDEVIKEAKNRNLRTAIVFHDALPYKLPSLYPTEATVAHVKYMKQLTGFDCILPNSMASAADLQAFYYKNIDRLINLDKKINPVLLPGEFREHPRITAYQEPDSKTIRILSVGTIERRKNHLTLLEAFDRVTRGAGLDAELVLIGHCHNPEIEGKLKNYMERNKCIYWLRHVDDAVLNEEYTKCHFTVYPSVDEGFGLPVLESLWYAKPCICRNYGALAETAAGGGCLMVDTTSIVALEESIKELATNKEARRKLGEEAINRKLKTWDEYGREILLKMSARMEKRTLTSSLGPASWSSGAEKQPMLSICISTYNRAKWLAVSLATLMGWTELYRDIVEVLVCDNTSTDNTSKVAQTYANKKNFRYHCNPANVGMLGNLKVTANLARGKYIWILGDDDLVKEGAVEAVLAGIRRYPDVSLVYLNYAYTRIAEADKVGDVDNFLHDSTPIVTPTPDQYAPIKDLAVNSENFFTAIYCLVFRRDHAVKAYSQNTAGRPFSTLLTCIPTSYYVCHNMFEEMGLWIGQPSVVVNMNVSWLKYAPLWILERVPELYDLAEEKGSSPEAMDKWREHNFPGVLHYLHEIYFSDTENNIQYFSIDRLIQRTRHLPIFKANIKQFFEIYGQAYTIIKTAELVPPETLIQKYNFGNIKQITCDSGLR
jgi:FkbM family methyltransferase